MWARLGSTGLLHRPIWRVIRLEWRMFIIRLCASLLVALQSSSRATSDWISSHLSSPFRSIDADQHRCVLSLLIRVLNTCGHVSSFGCILIVSVTMLIFFLSHQSSRRRTDPRTVSMPDSLPNVNGNRNDLDRQVEELLRRTPIIPFEQVRWNQCNRINLVGGQANPDSTSAYIQSSLTWQWD